jgi:hypothetical protein
VVQLKPSFGSSVGKLVIETPHVANHHDLGELAKHPAATLFHQLKEVVDYLNSSSQQGKMKSQLGCWVVHH